MLQSKGLDMDCTVQRVEHELETEQQHGHYSCHLNTIPKGSVCLFVFSNTKFPIVLIKKYKILYNYKRGRIMHVLTSENVL